jgi:hypothetical protein
MAGWQAGDQLHKSRRRLCNHPGARSAHAVGSFRHAAGLAVLAALLVSCSSNSDAATLMPDSPGALTAMNNHQVTTKCGDQTAADRFAVSVSRSAPTAGTMKGVRIVYGSGRHFVAQYDLASCAANSCSLP